VYDVHNKYIIFSTLNEFFIGLYAVVLYFNIDVLCIWCSPICFFCFKRLFSASTSCLCRAYFNKPTQYRGCMGSTVWLCAMCPGSLMPDDELCSQWSTRQTVQVKNL